MRTSISSSLSSSYEVNRFNFSAQQNVVLPHSVVKSASAAVKTWRRKSGLNEMPRVIALDCVVNAQNELKVLSVEKSPLGIQLLKIHKPSFAKALSEFSSFTSRHDHNVCFPDHPGSIFEEQMGEFVLLPEEPSYDPEVISPNQSPRASYNNYGEGWLWNTVDYRNCEEAVDFDSGFCLKAIGQRRVYICPPIEKRRELRKKNIGGRRTVSQMLRVLREHEPMYVQPFIEPMLSPAGNPMIYSLYFIYNYRTGGYIYSGGLSIARKHLNIVLYGDGVTLGVID